MCTCPVFYTHSATDGPWGAFHLLAIVNGAAGNVGLQACLPPHIQCLRGYTPTWKFIETHRSSYPVLYFPNPLRADGEDGGCWRPCLLGRSWAEARARDNEARAGGVGVGIGIWGLFLSRPDNTLAVGGTRGEREMARLQLGGLSGW